MAGADELEEIIVRAEASIVTSTKTAGSGSAVNAETLELVRANHIHEALVRIPGVWVSRGSGQEHLTAIRSGVLTGPGACGGFLFLEDGIPIRPAGFCNVNNLFDEDYVASCQETTACYYGEGRKGLLKAHFKF